MKVLIFSKQSQWQGGVVNFVETLKKNLSPEISHQQFLMGNRKPGAGLYGRLMNAVGKVFWPIYDAVRLLFVVIFKHYDVYHINPSLNAQSLLRDGLFLVIIRLLSSSRIVVSFHGWENTTEQSIDRSTFLTALFYRVFNKADCILVLARPFQEWLIKHKFAAEKIHLFTTMFDGSVLQGVKSTKTGKDIHLLFLSRFVREKGIYELLEAFQILQRAHDNIYLNFAGAGGEEKQMQQWVKVNGLSSHVRFWGYVREEDKAEVFRQSDIFVFPTYYGEGCPVSLLEAMAAGLGVVTTPVGGIPDIVTSDEYGILIDQQVKVDQLHAAIKKLVENRDYLDAMKQANASMAWKKYEAQVVTKHFEAFYYE